MLAQASESYIAIKASATPHNGIVLQGKYRVRSGFAGVPIDGPEIMKHVVMVVTRAGNYQTIAPFAESFIFDDDVSVDGDLCSGTFKVNVMDHIAFNGPGKYYLLCSVGTLTSNIEVVSIDVA